MTNAKGKTQPVGGRLHHRARRTRSKSGKFVRACRVRLKLTQSLLARRAGLEQNFISLIEVGRYKYIKRKQQEQLARALKCDFGELCKLLPVRYVAQPTVELGRLIRHRREELGFSLVVFAHKMKMTVQQAKHLELRKNPTIRYNLIGPLAVQLRLELSVLSKFAGRTQRETVSKLGKVIRLRRRDLAMSIDALAKKLKVTRQFVDQIELGQCCLSADNRRIAQLATILKLDVKELEAVRLKRKRKHMDKPYPLGDFIADKRLELHLTQREVGAGARMSLVSVSGVETGRVCPSLKLLDKLAGILKCQIPPELIPVPKKRGRPRLIEQQGLPIVGGGSPVQSELSRSGKDR